LESFTTSGKTFTYRLTYISVLRKVEAEGTSRESKNAAKVAAAYRLLQKLALLTS